MNINVLYKNINPIMLKKENDEKPSHLPNITQATIMAFLFAT